MNSQEALALAIEQVNGMCTNARGYQDGVTLPMKVDAIERLAAFLMADGATDVAGAGDPDLAVTFSGFWVPDRSEMLHRCELCGAITDYDGIHTAWHRGLGR